MPIYHYNIGIEIEAEDRDQAERIMEDIDDHIRTPEYITFGLYEPEEWLDDDEGDDINEEE